MELIDLMHQLAFQAGGTMKASELIAHLQVIMEREGNDPICCSDLATTGPVPIKEAFYLRYEPDPANTEPPKWKEGQPLIMVW